MATSVSMSSPAQGQFTLLVENYLRLETGKFLEEVAVALRSHSSLGGHYCEGA